MEVSLITFHYLIYIPFQAGASFDDSCCHQCFVIVLNNWIFCSFQPCGHLLGRADTLALMFFWFFFLVFLPLSHVVSLVRCGKVRPGLTSNRTIVPTIVA